MTRFQIVGIFEDKILTAGEFNGDGYFENGHGEELCAQFPNIKTEKDYRELVKFINDEYFEYDNDVIFETDKNIKPDLFDFYRLNKEGRYFKVWFSDYLYIINLSTEKQKIIDEKGTEITILPGGWATINFGELYKQQDETLAIKCQNNVEIDYVGMYRDICKEHGWELKIYDDFEDIEIMRYTPAGEDFSFSVNKNEDFVTQVEDYYENFDVDEHALMWAQSGTSGVPRLRELLEDAEWIDDKLRELADALKEVNKDD